MKEQKSEVRDQKAESKKLRNIHTLIAQRYEDYCKSIDVKCSDRTTTMMDLQAVSMAYPNFDWDGLLMADDFNFCHDIGGIKRHIDRSKAFTGKDDLAHLLTDCFLPRFARRATPALTNNHQLLTANR